MIMNPRIKKVYASNLEILEEIIGLQITSAIEEQYFFEGKLDTDSKGTLKLVFSNNQEITFNCDMDAESLSINRGGFTDKKLLTKSFEDQYRWEEKEFLSYDELEMLGTIVSTKIQNTKDNNILYQIGCKIHFESGSFLNVWTSPSDNIFYAMNEENDFNKYICH